MFVLFLAALASTHGSALRFSHDGQLAMIPYQAPMDVKQMTLEAWIKVDDQARERFFNYIVSRNYGNLGFGFAIHGNPVKVFSQAPSVPVPMNVWTHVALVVSDKAQKLYVNGELAAAEARDGELRPYARPFLIGNSPFSGEPGGQPTGFRGVIDEVRLWSKPHTQAEVRATMNRYLRGNEPHLVAYLPFEEGKGQIVHDYSGHLLSGCVGNNFLVELDQDAEWVEGVPLKGRVPKIRTKR